MEVKKEFLRVYLDEIAMKSKDTKFTNYYARYKEAILEWVFFKFKDCDKSNFIWVRKNDLHSQEFFKMSIFEGVDIFENLGMAISEGYKDTVFIEEFQVVITSTIISKICR